jgi:hypothetical protein
VLGFLDPTRFLDGRMPLDAGRAHDACAAVGKEAGIDAVEAFLGSGHYAVQLEIGRNDVQPVLAAFFNDPRVRAFRDQLAPVTEGLPGPDYRFGAADPDAAGQTIYNTGDLHFAAGMARWRRGEAPQAGVEPQGRASRTSS